MFLLLSTLAYIGCVIACSYDDVVGEWQFHIGTGGNDHWIDCSIMGLTHKIETVKLLYPDLAVDKSGNHGFWTMINFGGIEVNIHGRIYTAPFDGLDFCTATGWTHEIGGHDWACFRGFRYDQNHTNPDKTPKDESQAVLSDDALDQLYVHDPDYIDQINAAQDLWTAVHYPEYEKMTYRQLRRRSGWKVAAKSPPPKPMKPSRELQDRASRLPDNFDWRDVDGVNYISPVRDQGSCGSCYAFAAAAMNEARLLIHTGGAVDVTLSPQDVVDCSPYSYACDGGWPYLIAGRYAEDFGMVEEHCNLYRANVTGMCETDASCNRYYTTGRKYVGGYFGACNEEAMRISLVENGPFVVVILANLEFNFYKSGIYRESGVKRKFDPFEDVNHAVLLVGYGVDEQTGTKYWTIKNSWGTEAGDEGYHKIERGVNMLAIESGAMEAFPVF